MFCIVLGFWFIINGINERGRNLFPLICGTKTIRKIWIWIINLIFAKKQQQQQQIFTQKNSAEYQLSNGVASAGLTVDHHHKQTNLHGVFSSFSFENMSDIPVWISQSFYLNVHLFAFKFNAFFLSLSLKSQKTWCLFLILNFCTEKTTTKQTNKPKMWSKIKQNKNGMSSTWHLFSQWLP